MTILALDFDGVAHSVTSTKMFTQLGLLEGWLRQHPEVRVVLTTSWREHQSLAALRGAFSADLRERVIGVTPVFERVFGQSWSLSPAERELAKYQRQVEIERFMEDAKPDEPWLALDDQPSLFKKDCPQLVVCDPRQGLTEATLAVLTAKYLAIARTPNA